MNKTTLIIGGFTWDVESRKLERIASEKTGHNSKEVSLTPKQFRLLQCLYHAHPSVLQRNEIVDFVWESKPTSPESLPQLINRTRIVLGDTNKDILVNEPGVGYSLNFELHKEQQAAESRAAIESSAKPIGCIKAKPIDLKTMLIMPILFVLTLCNLGSAIEASYYKHQFISAFFAKPYPNAKQIDNNNISIVIDNNECNYTKNTQLLKCQ
ncbi:helix-turn-helix domain-containing protein [Vibrio ponticus]|uniref:Helix-turn-helix domain-containing protein n=1 Tax=Vibrio ponticus TaxID=265668 RepID=A0A3N3E0M7_9VIBR|nr:winged helix-turn-helix domain-containing protein [Vibrio ponticus]ROV60297.1 helix-turn-helix domain-containing protein [Vibrio ponticus]